jgi:2-C-methyl-D-erythritol 4-phosphate cytidylyltransferase
MKCMAIVVAGGSGKRFGTALPKQFALLNGRPVLMHSIEAFARCNRVSGIRVVLPAAHFDLWRALCSRYGFSVDHQLVEGGHERFFSVMKGLAGLDEEALVAVHDGVRPLVSSLLINRLCEAALQHGAAVPVVAVNESLRRHEGNASVAVDRSLFMAVQTPQVFKASILLKAYQQPYSSVFTDDASVVEAMGYGVATVSGDPVNIKITTRADLLFAQAVLAAEIDPGAFSPSDQPG